jgi:hypothetical protein
MKYGSHVNIHTHTIPQGLQLTEEEIYEKIRPSTPETCAVKGMSDLKFARLHNDLVRIILLTDGKSPMRYFVHDKFGNKIPIKLEMFI